MALKPCYECAQLVPAGQFERHRQAHRNATKSSHNTSEWDALSKRIKRRDGFKCQRCHRSKAELERFGLSLHVHHVNGESSDNRPENLLTLCEQCHPKGGDQRWSGL